MLSFFQKPLDVANGAPYSFLMVYSESLGHNLLKYQSPGLYLYLGKLWFYKYAPKYKLQLHALKRWATPCSVGPLTQKLLEAEIFNFEFSSGGHYLHVSRFGME